MQDLLIRLDLQHILQQEWEQIPAERSKGSGSEKTEISATQPSKFRKPNETLRFAIKFDSYFEIQIFIITQNITNKLYNVQ